MLVAAFSIAAIQLAIVWLGTFEWTRLNRFDEFRLFLLALVLGGVWAWHYDRTYQEAFAVAFIADGVLTVRLLLDVVSDVCKGVIVTRARSRR